MTSKSENPRDMSDDDLYEAIVDRYGEDWLENKKEDPEDPLVKEWSDRISQGR